MVLYLNRLTQLITVCTYSTYNTRNIDLNAKLPGNLCYRYLPYLLAGKYLPIPDYEPPTM